MKKILTLVLALLIVFALCGCGETTANETDESPAAEAEEPAEAIITKVALVY